MDGSTSNASDDSRAPLQPGPTPVALADLKRKSVRGGAVTLAAQGVSVVIHLVSTIVLARLLVPEDFGVIAMVVAVTSFAGLFRDLGLSAAAIQKGVLTQAQMSNLFWVNVLMGAILTGLMAAASPLVASFYGKPELTPLTVLLSTTFLISALGTQHGALLQRQLMFGRKAVTSIAGSLIHLTVSIGLAVAGYRYWSLAWATIAGAVVTTVLLFVLSPFRPGVWTRGAGLRSLLTFGANVTGFDVVNYFHRNLDNILLGRFWGPDVLGIYSRAYSLLMFPIVNLRGPINAVAFPAMSQLQGEPDAYRTYYRRVTALLAITSMPLTMFLLVAADPLIELTLGKAWSSVSPIFTLLAITAFIQPTAGLRGLVLLSTGQGKRFFYWGAFNAICTSIGFACGLPWGAEGMAVAYAVVTYLLLYPSLLLAFHNTRLTAIDFFGPIAVPALASLSGAVVCHLAYPHLAAATGSNPLLMICGLASIFGAVLLAIFGCLPAGRREVKQVSGALRQLKGIRSSTNVSCVTVP